MTGPIVALLALSPLSARVQAKSAAEIVGACFEHYYNAKSVSGRIHETQSVANRSISIDTDVAYERPSKLYINQRQSGAEGGQWVVLSDGNVFSYPKPRGADNRLPVYREAVVQPDGRVQTIPEMYVAIQRSIKTSPPIDIAMANREILQKLKLRWASLRTAGTGTVRDQTVNIITGETSVKVGDPPAGQFEMDVTPEGDLLRYTTKIRWADPVHAGSYFDVLDDWEVDLKVNTPVDPKTFKSG